LNHQEYLICTASFQIKALETQYTAISDINQKTHFLLNISDEGEVSVLPLSDLLSVFKGKMETQGYQ